MSLNFYDFINKVQSLEESGEKVIRLDIGEPDHKHPETVNKCLTPITNNITKKSKVRYGNPLGIFKLRECLAELWDVSPDEIIITPGAKYAIFLSLLSNLKQGNNVLTFAPFWPAYKGLCDLLKLKNTVINTNFNNNWDIPFNEVEKQIKNIDAIILNSPSNPTSKIIDKSIFRDIVELCTKNNVFIISDEVYSDLSYKKCPSLADFSVNNGVIVSGFSKSYSMTGFRLGYAICTRPIIERIKKLVNLTITNVPEFIQEIGYNALLIDDNYSKNVISHYKERSDLVTSLLNKSGLFIVNQPDAAFYLFPKLLNNKTNDFIIKLLEEHKISVISGDFFGGYKNHFRMSLVKPIPILKNVVTSMISVAKTL